MGKLAKKGRPPPQKNKRVAAALSPKVVPKRSSPNGQSAVDVVIDGGKQCAHLEKGIDLVKLSEKIGSAEPVRCQDCRIGAGVQGGGKGKGKNKKGGSSKAIWVCLECGCYACGAVGFPTTAQSHALRHFKATKHSLVMQYENPHLCWCFPCNSLIPVLKSEEDGKEKGTLFDILKLIKRLPVEGGPKDVYELWVGSDENSKSEARLESTVSNSINAKGGYMVRGLLNLGNTCFFNSIVQNLMAMDKLRDYFLKLDDGSRKPLSSSLRKLFVETSFETESRNVINPKSFFGCVCSKAPQFRGYDQHDSHELLRCLLDGLCTEELVVRKQNSCQENGESPDQFPSVGGIFRGQVSSTVCCMLCGHSSTVYEPFLDLSLAVSTKKAPTKKSQPVPPPRKTKLPPKRAGRSKARKDAYLLPPDQSVSISYNVSSSSEQILTAGPDPENIVASSADGTQLDLLNSARKDAYLLPPDQKVSISSNISSSSQQVLTAGPHPENSLASSEDSTRLDLLNPSTVADNDGSASYRVTGVDYDPHQTSSQFCDLSWLDYLDEGTFADDNEVTSQNNEMTSLNNEVTSHNNEMTSLNSEVTSLNNEVTSQNSEVSMEDSCKEVDVQERDLMENSSSSTGLVCFPSVDPNVELTSSFASPCVDEVPMQVHGSELLFLPYKEVSTEEKIEEGDTSSFTVHGQDLLDLDGFGDLFNEPETNTENEVLARTNSGSEDDVDNANHVVSIESCLALFTKPELLSDEHAWHCDNCSKKLQRENKKLMKNKGKIATVLTTNGGRTSSHICNINSSNGLNCSQGSDVDDGNIKVDTDFNASSESLPLTRGNESNNTACSQESSSYQSCDSCSVNKSNSNMNTADEIRQIDPEFPTEECESEESEDEELDSNCMMLKRDATKRFLIDKAPPILTIHLNRFSQDARGRVKKLNGHVSFQTTFDLRPFMDPRHKETDRCDYRLIGVVEHSGSMNRGHYVAFIRGEKNKGKDGTEDGSFAWYYVSDARVRQLSVKEVLRCEAYILFYEKI